MSGVPFGDIARWHARRYPEMEAQDFIKLAYQSARGSGHLLPSPEKALAFLKQELAATPQTDAPLFVPLGGGLCRLELAGLAASGLRLETVVGMFAAAEGCGGLEANLSALEGLAAEGALPISGDERAAALRAYRGTGMPAVHHSDAYRAAYHPAYRLAPALAAANLAVFQRIDALLREKRHVRVAIDGMSGAGKSTLGALLAKVYGANLFHMDDFFLPAARKTPERLAQPGGNVDYERFAVEVAVRGPEEAFTYRRYDCAVGALCEPTAVEPRRVWIVEGAYSLHPTLRDGYDLKLGMFLSPEEQSRRILARNGPMMHRRFLEEWIPLENTYIQAEGLRERCDLYPDADAPGSFYEKFGLRAGG